MTAAMRARPRPPRGFTLLELLVAITVLSIVSMIAWRGLDSLVLTRERLEPESDEVRALLAAFGQMERDLAQIVTPSLVGLSSSPVVVRASSQGPVLEVLRTAANDGRAPTALQTVFYRVDDGRLIRQASAPRRTLAAQAEEQLSSARLLDRVKGIRIRLWRDVAWADPLIGGAEPPAPPPNLPGVVVPVPQGVEIVVERNDGRLFRRVLLVG